jgi:hypothetical protein
VGRFRPDGAGYRLDSPERWDHGRRLFFAPWAGFPCDESMPNRHLHDRFVARARSRLGEQSAASPARDAAGS